MCDWATDTAGYGPTQPFHFFGSCAEYMDSMDVQVVLRADFDAYIQGQRRQHSKTSSSTKARSTRRLIGGLSQVQAE